MTDVQLAGGYAYARLAAIEVLEPATGNTVAAASAPPPGDLELLEAPGRAGAVRRPR